jgi:glycosyltransferase involved in cell wall biosynthesis
LEDWLGTDGFGLSSVLVQPKQFAERMAVYLALVASAIARKFSAERAVSSMTAHPSVIYSFGNKFAGAGIGTIAFYEARELYRHGLVQRILCGAYAPTEIPETTIRAIGLPNRILCKLASLEPSGWLWYVQAVLYDAVGCSLYRRAANLFHVWGGYGSQSLRRAKAQGVTTVVQIVSSHPNFQNRLMREEFARWGRTWRVCTAGLARTLREIDQADYILIPSDFVRESFLAEGIPESKLIQVPFGVDVSRFTPATASKGRPFRVVFVGQVGLRKGVPYLLEAWKRLGWRDAELWLVGRVLPEIKEVLKGYADLPGVRIMGFLGTPAAAYQQADIFVFPSLEEGSALVTYEAMACGLPVVTTPNAGSLVRDGVEGFIVPIRDPDALAERMERLRANARLRQALGRAARMRAEEFTWEQHGQALIQHYKSI